MFDYVNCFGREEFEDEWADFDLVQTFPRLSLCDKKQKTESDSMKISKANSFSSVSRMRYDVHVMLDLMKIIDDRIIKYSVRSSIKRT